MRTMRTMRWILLLGMVALLPVSPVRGQEAKDKDKGQANPAGGEQPAVDVAKTIEQGLAAYRAGDHVKAVTLLQKAINDIQKAGQQGWSRFFPTVEGWKAGDIDAQSSSTGSQDQAFQMTQLRRTYREVDGKRSVEITITDSPQLVESTKATVEMYKNPQMAALMKQDPNKSFEVIDKDGWVGFVMIEKGSSGQVLALCGSTLVTLSISSDKPEVMRKFWDAMDHKQMAAQATKK